MFYPKFGKGDAKKDVNVVQKGRGDSSTSPHPNTNDTISGRFDPTALERGAKALRDLDSSPNAVHAFEITRLQETTRQTELKKDMEQMQCARVQMQLDRARIEAEERKKYATHQQEQERITARYKAQLEAEAYSKKLQDQQQLNEHLLKRQHEEFLRQQQIRKENEQQMLRSKLQHLKQEKELEKDILKVKIHEEAKGRILQERENLDVHLREMKAKAKEQRKTHIEAIQTTLSTVGSACNTLLEDKKKLTALVTGFTALTLGYFGTKTGTRILGHYIESRLGKPVLIRETSRWTLTNNWRYIMFPWLKRHLLLSDKIVLPKGLNERLQWTSNSLMASRRHGIPFRHLLVYGDPGTGKTLFARTLARESGLDYAIMAGGDIGPLGRDAVTEMNKVFTWAKKSPKGVILFIDEAEAFLRQGRAHASNTSMTEETRHVLSTFLHHTGTETTDICIILATNEKDILDKAILDRIDAQFKFPLPEFEERLTMIKLFIDQHFMRPTSKGKKITVASDIDAQFFETIARQTQGFSGRQLAKLIVAMQAAVLGSGTDTLTKSLGETVLQWHMANIQQQYDEDQTPSS